MTKADETNRHLREAILDLLSFFAVYKLSLSAQEVLQYLPVKASSVGVKHHLDVLVKRGKLRQFKKDRYGIKKIDYSGSNNTLQYSPSKSTKRLARLISRVPFVKSVVFCSDNLFDTNHNVQNLIVVTTPSRIYTTKDIITRLQKIFGKNKPLGDVGCNIYFSTAGIRFSDLMAKSSLESTLWFALSKPLYGKDNWLSMLKNDKFVHSNLPNYAWPRLNLRIHTSTSKFLDDYDNKRYRNYLREMAAAADFQHSTSLLRVRPDVFIARRLHNTQTRKTHQSYMTIREKV